MNELVVEKQQSFAESNDHFNAMSALTTSKAGEIQEMSMESCFDTRLGNEEIESADFKPSKKPVEYNQIQMYQPAN